MNRACPDCGSPIAWKATACRCGWRDKETKPDGRNVFACTAYGCPMMGTTTRGGSHDRYCTIHAAHEDKDLQAITKGIRKRFSLIAAIARIMMTVDTVTWWKGELDDYFQIFHDARRPHLLPTSYERTLTPAHWYSRALNDIEGEILADMGIHRTRKAPQEQPPAPPLRPFEVSPEDRATQAAAEADIAERERLRNAREALQRMMDESAI